MWRICFSLKHSWKQNFLLSEMFLVKQNIQLKSTIYFNKMEYVIKLKYTILFPIWDNVYKNFMEKLEAFGLGMHDGYVLCQI